MGQATEEPREKKDFLGGSFWLGDDEENGGQTHPRQRRDAESAKTKQVEDAAQDRQAHFAASDRNHEDQDAREIAQIKAPASCLTCLTSRTAELFPSRDSEAPTWPWFRPTTTEVGLGLAPQDVLSDSSPPCTPSTGPFWPHTLP